MYLIIKQLLVSLEDFRKDSDINCICEMLCIFIEAVHCLHTHLVSKVLLILDFKEEPTGQNWRSDQTTISQVFLVIMFK